MKVRVSLIWFCNWYKNGGVAWIEAFIRTFKECVFFRDFLTLVDFVEHGNNGAKLISTDAIFLGSQLEKALVVGLLYQASQ